MKSESSGGSKLMGRVVKGSFAVAGTVLVVYYALLLWFGVFFLSPDWYGSYFYSWRVLYADNLMTHGRYKMIKVHDYPLSDEREAFYDIAQGNERYLVDYDRPEHYPREHDQHYSLNFKEYVSFLNLRQNYILWSEGIDKKALDKPETGKKGLFFSPAPKNSTVDKIADILFTSTRSWHDVARCLVKCVVEILEGNPDYKFDGVKAADGLSRHVIDALLKLGIEVSPDRVNSIFRDFGRVSSGPYDTFGYSRAYYLFYFLTGGIDFKGLKENSTNEDRMNYVSHLFARIVSNIYPNGKDGPKDAGLFERIRAIYSPCRSVNPDPVVDVDLQLVLNNFRNSKLMIYFENKQ